MHQSACHEDHSEAVEHLKALFGGTPLQSSLGANSSLASFHGGPRMGAGNGTLASTIVLHIPFVMSISHRHHKKLFCLFGSPDIAASLALPRDPGARQPIMGSDPRQRAAASDSHLIVVEGWQLPVVVAALTGRHTGASPQS